MIRVAVVDDQALVRAGFVVLLESAPELDVVGSAADGAQAVDLVVETLPDVVLMDIRMPVMDGLEATRRILKDPRCTVCASLILTTFDLDEYVYAALQAGAEWVPPQGHAAGRAARRRSAGGRRGRAALARHHPAPHRGVRPAVAEGRSLDVRSLDVLTERERDVLALVAKGLSNAEIATRLYISPATVKTHIARTLSTSTRETAPS